jgi:hypothetical protein
MLVELLSTHSHLLVALVWALVHLEGATVLFKVRKKTIVGEGFQLALFYIIGFNLVRNFLLFRSIFLCF